MKVTPLQNCFAVVLRALSPCSLLLFTAHGDNYRALFGVYDCQIRHPIL